MNKQTLETLAGRPVVITDLAERVGVSRQTIYDAMKRGYFTPPLARKIAKELRIRRKDDLVKLLGLDAVRAA